MRGARRAMPVPGVHPNVVRQPAPRLTDVSIWAFEATVDELNAMSSGSLIATLGIEVTEITATSLKGRMPVDARTTQPAGVLHGGASVALAETLASWAGYLASTAPASTWSVRRSTRTTSGRFRRVRGCSPRSLRQPSADGRTCGRSASPPKRGSSSASRGAHSRSSRWKAPTRRRIAAAPDERSAGVVTQRRRAPASPTSPARASRRT